MAFPDAEYSFVRTSRDNIHLLVPLFAAVFGRRESAAYFIRKYTTRWTKNGQYWGYMALNGKGECVSHFAAMPALFSLEGKDVLAAQSCDAATAREVRGKGLFAILGKMTYEILQQEGCQFIFGFTNEHTTPATARKLGWEHLENLAGYRIRVWTLPLERICRKLSFPYALYLRWVDFCFSRQKMTDLIPNSCIAGKDGGILRDQHFYDCHSISFNRQTRIRGVGVWWKLHAQLTIGDLERAPEPQILSALRALRRKCWWLGITEIIFQASPGTYHEKIFARHFPSFESWAIMYGHFSAEADFSRIKFTCGDIDSF